jgi:hypothetical protein
MKKFKKQLKFDGGAWPAFGVEGSDKASGWKAESGVALAAILELNQKLVEKDKEIMTLNEPVEELRQLVPSLAGKKCKGVAH